MKKGGKIHMPMRKALAVKKKLKKAKKPKKIKKAKKKALIVGKKATTYTRKSR
jgi:hypothetical protein